MMLGNEEGGGEERARETLVGITVKKRGLHFSTRGLHHQEARRRGGGGKERERETLLGMRPVLT